MPLPTQKILRVKLESDPNEDDIWDDNPAAVWAPIPDSMYFASFLIEFASSDAAASFEIHGSLNNRVVEATAVDPGTSMIKILSSDGTPTDLLGAGLTTGVIYAFRLPKSINSGLVIKATHPFTATVSMGASSVNRNSARGA